jgi:hypothetical protein
MSHLTHSRFFAARVECARLLFAINVACTLYRTRDVAWFFATIRTIRLAALARRARALLARFVAWVQDQLHAVFKATVFKG